LPPMQTKNRSPLWSNRFQVRPFDQKREELVLLFRINGNLLTRCIEAFKLYNTINEGEQSEVSAHANIGAAVEVGATLTNDDVASLDDFACVLLNTEILGVRVATVTY